MTTIITRLYSNLATAETVAAALGQNGYPADDIQVISDGQSPAAAAAMKAARVDAKAAAAYASAMTGDQALLVVQVGFNPIGAAKNAMRIADRSPSIKVGLEDEDVYYREVPETRVAGNVLTSHPLLMSNPFARPSHGHILGSNPVIQSRPRTSAIRGGAYMSKMFWPMKLVSAGRTSRSAISGTWTLSGMFGIATICRR